MFIATPHPRPIKLRRSGMSPRWGLKPDCMVAGYKQVAPPALDMLPAKADALKRLQAETAAELDALLSAILDQAFRGDL